MTVVSESLIHKERLFEKEFMPHADALYNFAYQLSYNDDDANDLVQETYMKAFRFIDSYQEGTNSKAWLFKILKNIFINEYRRKKREPEKIDYDDVITFSDEDDDNSAAYFDLREDLFDNMMGDEITNALNKLPIEFKTVILLCDIEGFSYEEIAKIIDIPIGTVRSRLHRARNMLKQLLKDYADQMGFEDNDEC
ncbi:MAG TPA: sigma-70 family RNA polymerase sigma factor [Chitinophagales bacterium]|nr:sigma-70 family RNA polymerase sigma factor [Chitinophagales bacterium]HNL83606.1 sigma-70 family RNA polymerase sigma factor [Chitinophagales bacterium]